MKRIFIVNGPNLDRLGVREPSIYGNATLADLENRLSKEAEALGVELTLISPTMKASSLMR